MRLKEAWNELGNLPRFPLDPVRKEEIKKLVLAEVRKYQSVSNTFRTVWSLRLALSATAAAFLCATGIWMDTNALLHQQTVTTITSAGHPASWNKMLDNWRKFGISQIKLPYLPFAPTIVTSGENQLYGRARNFNAMFLNQKTGDFAIFYADNTRPSPAIKQFSENIGLAHNVMAVYYKLGGLQVMEWKNKNILCTLQTGKGFKGYTGKEMSKAQLYPTLAQLINTIGNRIGY